MTMTDAYELARRSNAHLYPIVEDFVDKAGDKSDFPPSSTGPLPTPRPPSCP